MTVEITKRLDLWSRMNIFSLPLAPIPAFSFHSGFHFRSLRMDVPGPSRQTPPENPPSEVLSCENCFLSYGDFCVAYTQHFDKLVLFSQNHGLILKEKLCPTCNNICTLDLVRKTFRCQKSVALGHKRRKKCSFEQSIFKGTWFDHSHLDLESNLKFVVLFLQEWFSYKCAQYELRMSDPAINDWSSFCREVCVSWVMKRSKKIGGEGCTIEIDESKFGRRKYNVGRVIEGQWVFGGICRESRAFFMVPVADRTSDTLLSIISEYIEPGSTIISDCWKAYDCLSKEGYQHLKVNHSVNFVDPSTKAHTNTIERHWRNTKNLVPKYGRRKAHFVGYLAVSYFKLHYTDPTRRLHFFSLAAAQLYPPSA